MATPALDHYPRTVTRGLHDDSVSIKSPKAFAAACVKLLNFLHELHAHTDRIPTVNA